jgi:hypothetical protein
MGTVQAEDRSNRFIRLRYRVHTLGLLEMFQNKRLTLQGMDEPVAAPQLTLLMTYFSFKATKREGINRVPFPGPVSSSGHRVTDF